MLLLGDRFPVHANSRRFAGRAAIRRRRYPFPMAADPMVDLRRRFTVEEFERMGEVGLFGPDERVELLEGEIVAMSPIGPKHASAVDVIAEEFVLRLARRAAVRVQNPVRLLPLSEPQPDIVIARRRRDAYRSGHPTAEDVLLMIEVADSSLWADRSVKLPIYARKGIVEVWIVDLDAEVAHLHADLVDGSYRVARTLGRGEVLTPTALPDVELAVDAIFGD